MWELSGLYAMGHETVPVVLPTQQSVLVNVVYLRLAHRIEVWEVSVDHAIAATWNQRLIEFVREQAVREVEEWSTRHPRGRTT